MDEQPGWVLQILTTDEVAGLLKMSRRSVQRLIHDNQLQARKIGRAYRVLGLDLLTFLRSGD